MNGPAPTPLATAALQQLVEGRSLDGEQAAALMQEIIAGRVHDIQVAAILTALRMKGETPREVAAFARVLRAEAEAVRPAAADPGGRTLPELVDTCGTGGDSAGTFNISTAAALVAAAAGLRVAKHGNRSVSGRCGSADVAEALGIAVGLSGAQVARCIDEVGIGFLFAPRLHGAMKAVMAARREMKIRTVFNLLGPLTNPAGASCQVVGVYSAERIELVAGALSELGARRAFVVHGEGLDEFTTTGATEVAEVQGGQVVRRRVTPEDFGLPRAAVADLAGGDAQENAAMILGILEGRTGPRRDVVLMNAAAVLVAGGAAPGFRQGVAAAAAAVDSGEALGRLRRLAALSTELSRS